VSLQEEIFSRPIEIIKLLIETLVDFLANFTMELVPSLTAMRASFFLRSPDVHYSLQIFLQEASSQEIGALVCELVFSGAKLLRYVARILFELSLIVTGLSRTHGNLFYLHHLGFNVMR